MSDTDDDLDSGLPYGSHPVSLSRQTQDLLECVANWNVSVFEPLKFVPAADVKDDLEKNGAESDFYRLGEEIKASQISEFLFVFDEKESFGSEFIICTTQTAVAHFVGREEDAEESLVDMSAMYEYKPPEPVSWSGYGSHAEIENDFVTDSRPKIHLTVKLAPRKVGPKSWNFSDRNVDDVKDGYVSCEPFQDTTRWGQVRCMDRGMQAVPVLVEGGTQTQLTHPNNVFIQYESRSFTNDELKETFESKGFKKFLNKAETMFNDVQEQGDIMGDIKKEVHSFYMRDYVEEKIETRLIEHLSLSDLVFSRNKRVKDVRWHPRLGHIVGMTCVDNLDYDQYIDNMSQRILAPNYLMIWSTKHFIYPQLLLKAPEDITVFQWHPTDDATLLGGLSNGQIVLWDLSEQMRGLEEGACTWDHKKMDSMEDIGQDWNEEKGFIPVVDWSAESSIAGGHMEEVMDIQFVPPTIKFDQESAFPKESNEDDKEREVQFISCARENFFLIWQIDKFVPEAEPVMVPIPEPAKKPGFGGFAGVTKKEVAPPPKVAEVRPRTGRYAHLNEKWVPMYKLTFREQSQDEEDESLFQMCIQNFVVLDRPELAAAMEKAQGSGDTSRRGSKDGSEIDLDGQPLDEEVNDNDLGLDDADGGVGLNDAGEAQQVVKAIPTFIVGGTLQGGVFRANLALCNINVETGDLVCVMEWYKIAHDGPVSTVTRSPFFSDLVLTVGGYLFAVWRETELTQPLIVKSSGDAGLTGGCWSLSRPSFVFTSCEDGNIQCWNLLAGGNSPIQKQNTSGYTITCITGYYADPALCCGDDNIGGHYLSIADTTGTIRLLTLPRHMHETPAAEEEDTRDFTLRETERLKFITGRSSETDEANTKKDKKDKKGEKGKEEKEEETEEQAEEKISPSQQLLQYYLDKEDEVLIKMGLRQPKVEERRKSSIGADRRKSSINPAALMKGFLKP